MGSESMLKEMVCITCPIGCHLTIRQDGEEIEVSGNTCPRGKQYAIAEMTHPTRMLTTTVVIKNAIYLIRQTAGTAFDMWQKFAFTFVLVASFVLL